MLGALNYMQADEIDVLVVGLPVSEVTARKSALVQCAALFCTYSTAATKAALARVTLARMSVALARNIERADHSLSYGLKSAVESATAAAEG